jgi:hypothetical protein
MDANGFIPVISDFFINNNIQLLFSLLMLFVAYPISTALIVLIDMGVIKIIKMFAKEKDSSSNQEQVVVE